MVLVWLRLLGPGCVFFDLALDKNSFYCIILIAESKLGHSYNSQCFNCVCVCSESSLTIWKMFYESMQVFY